jgi:hypothetical protein
MELTVLTEEFLPEHVIDNFTSLIWTERYTSAGDVQLVLLPTKFHIDILKPGTFLSIPDSKEIMIVDTALIEGGLLKVKGPSLIDILNHRFIWEPDDDDGFTWKPTSTSDNVLPKDYTRKDFAPGRFITHVVNRFAIVVQPFPRYNNVHALNVETEQIPNLLISVYDDSGVDEELTARLGPIYDAIKPIAEMYKVGMSLYLDYVNTGGSYGLRFKTYKGKNRTSNQTENTLMRLAPSFDEISDIKELVSNTEEINNVYVFSYNQFTQLRFDDSGSISARHLGGISSRPTGPSLGRRTLIVHPALTPELYNKNANPTPFLSNRQLARYFLTRPVHIVDGQINSLANYKFGVDYGLGDLIELESYMGATSKARITEYIRSHDSSGEKAYPTVVVEP